MKMRIEEFLERYVFVRKCVGCGERMGYEHRNDAFCNACRISFERAKVMSCPECLMSMADCRCMPKSLERAGVVDVRRLVAYMGEHASHPENKLLYFLKRNKSKRVAGFVADQLLFKLEELIAANDEKREELLLAYVPRSRRACAKYGVDQARLVCEALAGRSGIRCLPLVLRKKDGRKEQKKLTASGRRKNVARLFELNERYREVCHGRSVIIFDDIITSGASVGACASLLKDAGADKIYALSIASAIKGKR